MYTYTYIVPFLDVPIATWNLERHCFEFPFTFRISLSLHFERAISEKKKKKLPTLSLLLCYLVHGWFLLFNYRCLIVDYRPVRSSFSVAVRASFSAPSCKKVKKMELLCSMFSFRLEKISFVKYACLKNLLRGYTSLRRYFVDKDEIFSLKFFPIIPKYIVTRMQFEKCAYSNWFSRELIPNKEILYKDLPLPVFITITLV